MFARVCKILPVAFTVLMFVGQVVKGQHDHDHDAEVAPVADHVALLSAVLLLISTALPDIAQAEQLPDGVKCLICDKAASAEHSADWKGGKVYLACPNCVATFRSDSDEYAVKANAQLVRTGQANQVACPILSVDGRNFPLIFTGTGRNDAWNTVRGKFILDEK